MEVVPSGYLYLDTKTNNCVRLRLCNLSKQLNWIFLNFGEEYMTSKNEEWKNEKSVENEKILSEDI